MRPRAVLVLAAIVTAGVVAAPSAGGAPGQDARIAVGGDRVYSIGNFVPGVRGTVGDAQDEFGPATSREPLGDNVCRVRWSTPRITIVFADFGGGGAAICGDRRARAQTFVARGTSFLTGAGLRPGMGERELRRRHPGARERRPGRWQLRYGSPVGQRFAILRATTSDGRVTALRGYFGAAGE